MTSPLTWLDATWLMMAGACLTLALVHGGSWLRLRSRWADFWFSIAALSIVGEAAVELGEMRATTAERFIDVHYWIHLPLFTVGVALLCFVPAFFRAGRPWLLFVGLALRISVLVVNFSLPNGINYFAVPAIARLDLPGGALASVALGVHTHWTHLDELAWFVAICFTADAARTAWRESPPAGRPRIVRVASAMLIVYLLGVPLSILVHGGLVHSPYFVTPIFMFLLSTMGIELSGDMARAERVSAELRVSQARLHDSERDLELAVESAGIGIGSLDLDSGALSSTVRGRQLFGYGDREPIQLDDLLTRVHPDDRDRIRASIERAESTKGSFDEEYRIATPDGGWRWLASRGRVDGGVEDGPSRMRGVTLEITARRQAEERFRLIFEAAQNALVIVDDRGRIVLANERAQSYFGYDHDELLAGGIDRLLPERLRGAHARHRAAFAEAPASRTMGVGFALVARRKDGSEFPVEIALSPLADPSGSLVLASIVDITERRERELDAARRQSELAHLSRVAVLGELSASLAHELNQPLAAILSNAQAAQRFLTRDEVDLGQIREIVGDIVEDDKRAGEVIRRLRAMLRKEELAHLPLDLNEVVDDVLQIMNSDFVNRGVLVETGLTQNLPLVSGDRVQLQQVLLNLMINGCDAMVSRPKPRRLLVRTVATGEAAEISVTNQGDGIPQEQLEKIFEPFVTTKAHGTGLGLAVCRTIVHSHGGRIWAKNDERGATFVVSLPLGGASS